MPSQAYGLSSLAVQLLFQSHLLGKPKQQVDVTQADDGDIQSESIDGKLAKRSRLMMGISKEKSSRTHYQ